MTATKSATAPPLRVLIADDSEADSTMLARFVRKQFGGEVQIFEVEGGAQAVELLRSRPIDVALVDYRLPDIDGLEVIDRASSLPRPTAMILLSGQGSERIAAQSIKRGARDYVVKQNLGSDELGRVITQAVTNARFDAEHARSVRSLEQNHQQLGQLVQSLSHDMSANFMLLENCFRHVQNSVEGRPGGDLSEGVSHVGACLEESKRLLADLALVGRTGSVDMTPQRLDLARVVADVLYELAPLIGQRGAAVKFDAHLPAVYAHETRIKQVFTNLVRNALKHGCDRVHPQISIEQIDPAEGADRGFVWVRVADNGRGIPLEHREDVFLPGRRLTPGESEGWGLGLAIVKKIVEYYGGSVTIEEPPDGGAAFVLSLPLADGQEA